MTLTSERCWAFRRGRLWVPSILLARVASRKLSQSKLMDMWVRFLVDDLKSITISSPAAFIFASSQVLNCVTFIFLFDKESLMVFTTDLKIGYCINFFKLFI